MLTDSLQRLKKSLVFGIHGVHLPCKNKSLPSYPQPSQNLTITYQALATNFHTCSSDILGPLVLWWLHQLTQVLDCQRPGIIFNEYVVCLHKASFQVCLYLPGLVFMWIQREWVLFSFMKYLKTPSFGVFSNQPKNSTTKGGFTHSSPKKLPTMKRNIVCSPFGLAS